MTESTLDAELAAAASRRWWNRWTVVIGVALLSVGGFVAGVEVQKAYGRTPAAAGPGGYRGQGVFPDGFPGGGAQTGQGAPGASQRAEATTGTVKLVDGATVYIQTASGEVITVRTGEDTSVSVPGDLKDLKAGDTVSVEGGADEEGTVTASTVTKTE